MLGGQISNQDEDEVEDELEALEAEMNGTPVSLPSVPKGELERKERAKERQREQEEQRTAMLAE
jgi:charged multivesicular body protein 6